MALTDELASSPFWIVNRKEVLRILVPGLIRGREGGGGDRTKWRQKRTNEIGPQRYGRSSGRGALSKWGRGD